MAAYRDLESGPRQCGIARDFPEMRSDLRAAICSGLLFAALFASQPAPAQHQPLVKPGVCAQGYFPVCAVKQKTLVTYVNACTARGVQARIIAADRACLEGCPPRYAPVCGVDAGGQRRVFGNACEAEKSGATDIRTGSCRRILVRRGSTKGESVGAPVP
jgi:hypothetical protein